MTEHLPPNATFEDWDFNSGPAFNEASSFDSYDHLAPSDPSEYDLAIAACNSDPEAYETLWAKYGQRVAEAVSKKGGVQESPAIYTDAESQRLSTLVQSLPEQRRKVILLQVMAGVPAEEVARVIDAASANAVNTARHVALKKLYISLLPATPEQLAKEHEVAEDRELAIAACNSDPEAYKTLWAKYGHKVVAAVNASENTPAEQPAEYTDEEGQYLSELVQGLSEKRRQAVLLRIMLDIPVKEVAEIIDANSISAVDAVRYQAIKKLRALLLNPEESPRATDTIAAPGTKPEQAVQRKVTTQQRPVSIPTPKAPKPPRTPRVPSTPKLPKATARQSKQDSVVPDTETAETPSLNDQEVLVAVQAGNTEAFGAFYHRYYKKILGHVRRRFPHEAEDITNEAFARVFNAVISGSKASFPRNGDAAAFLTTTATNITRDIAKSSRYKRTHLESNGTLATDRFYEHADLAESVPDMVIHADEARLATAAVTAAMAQLNPAQKRVIELRYFQGLSAAETAMAIDMTLGATKAHQHRALIALAGKLAHLRPDSAVEAPKEGTEE